MPIHKPPIGPISALRSITLRNELAGTVQAIMLTPGQIVESGTVLVKLDVSPGDVHAALQRTNYLAAVGRTKGNLVQVNLLANTDLRSAEDFRELIVAERNGAMVRLREIMPIYRKPSSIPRQSLNILILK